MEPSSLVSEIAVQLPSVPVAPPGPLLGSLRLSTKSASVPRSLELRVRVTERVQWEEYTVGGTTQVRSKKVHYDTTYPIKTFPAASLPAGTHVFPFALPLPATPDGSFEFVSGSHRARVRYGVKGILRGEAGTIVASAAVVAKILSRQSAPPVEEKQAEANVKISVASKGRCKMRVMIKRPEVAPGESALVLSMVDNSACRLNMREIVVRFLQKVRLTTTDGKVRTMEKQLAEQHFPGVSLGTAEKVPRILEIEIPTETASSTHSPMIECNHTVQVTGAFDGPFVNSINFLLPVLVQQCGGQEVIQAGVESVVTLTELKPPEVAKVNPLALVPVTNTCRELVLIPGQK